MAASATVSYCYATRPNPRLCSALAAASAPFTPNYSPPPPINLRFSYAVRLQGRKKNSVVYASNSGPSDEDSQIKESDRTKADQGPPFLTILAGFVVLFLVGWIIWSTLIWLIGLLVHLFPSK